MSDFSTGPNRTHEAGGSPPSADRSGRRREDVSVERVAPLGWRVRDLRPSQQDGHAMLGFIEQEDGRFEVIQLGEGFRLLTFESLDEAVRHLVQNVPEAPSGDVTA